MVRSEQGGLRFFAAILRVPLKVLWGMLFMQSFLGSILILGWTNRLIQRRALRSWWKQRPVQREDESFEDFIQGHSDLRIPQGWPNWFLTEDPPARRRRGPIIWVESLKTNFKSGFRTALNTWVVTAPPCVMWMFGWYFGWNNSFHKGYELSGIGPLTGLAGVFLFIAVMLYLPLAQVRQAVAGEWRAFYEFRFIRKLLRESWVACLFLALLYAFLFLPVTVLKTLPGFFPNMNPALLEATPLEVASILNRYFFWSALLVFPVFVVLRLVATRIYSASLLRAIRRGSIAGASLGSVEKTVLNELDLLQSEPRTPSTLPARFLGGGRESCGPDLCHGAHGRRVVLVFRAGLYRSVLYLSGLHRVAEPTAGPAPLVPLSAVYGAESVGRGACQSLACRRLDPGCQNLAIGTSDSGIFLTAAGGFPTRLLQVLA